MTHDDGGPAFPRPSSEAVDGRGNHFWPSAETGMSLRDWFAGMAMQGLFAGQCDDGWEPDAAAKMSYFVADAMIAERRDGSTNSDSATTADIAD